MAFFVVTYDCREGSDSQPLRDALDLMDSVHTQYSVWLVSEETTQKALLDRLALLIGPKDGLMVVQFLKRPSVIRECRAQRLG